MFIVAYANGCTVCEEDGNDPDFASIGGAISFAERNDGAFVIEFLGNGARLKMPLDVAKARYSAELSGKKFEIPDELITGLPAREGYTYHFYDLGVGDEFELPGQPDVVYTKRSVDYGIILNAGYDPDRLVTFPSTTKVVPVEHVRTRIDRALDMQMVQIPS